MEVSHSDTHKHAMTQADFLKSPFPAPVKMSAAEITGPRRFFNRELSWLAFNWRVLDEASNPAVPLLERLRFLSISATNLDEFYTVRVAGLRALKRTATPPPAKMAHSPAEQLVLINEDARRLLQHPANRVQQAEKRDGGAGHHASHPVKTDVRGI